MFDLLLAQRSFWLETPASTTAVRHDWVFNLLLYTMTFFFVLVVGVMLAFVVIYRRRTGQKLEEGPTHNTSLEIFWTIVPLGVVIGFFVIGLYGFVDLETPPPGADVVDVEASQWHFNFKYPNGAESNELYLRVGQPVLLRLTSKDVTHALYVPVFRVQRNAVPGRTTYLWFQPTELTGPNEANAFHAFCTQYCGDGHSEMHSWVYVLNQEDYDKKLADAANIFVNHATNKPKPYKEVGETIWLGNCAQCHTKDAKVVGQGPTWQNLYKSNVTFDVSNEPGYKLSEDDSDEKWDAYLVESILHPEAKIVHTFPNVMPSQESNFSDTIGGPPPKLSEIIARLQAGKPTTYKEKKLVAITEYIKSLGPKNYKEMKTPPLVLTNPETPAKPADTSKPAVQASGHTDKPVDEPKSTSPSKSKEEGK